MVGGNKLARYKRGQGFKLGTTQNKSSKLSERDMKPGLPNCHFDMLTTHATHAEHLTR